MTDLARLLAQRLTHDLAGPVGALATGVELLDGDDEITSLIADSVATLVAVLRLDRRILVPTVEVGAAVARAELAAWIASRDGITLDWRVVGTLAGDRAALLLGFAMIAAEAAPRGGALSVTDHAVDVAGHLAVDDALISTLTGAPPTTSRTAVAGMLYVTANAAGLAIEIERTPTTLRLRLYQSSDLPR